MEIPGIQPCGPAHKASYFEGNIKSSYENQTTDNTQYPKTKKPLVNYFKYTIIHKNVVTASRQSFG